MPTQPCPSVPHLPFLENLQGTVTPPRALIAAIGINGDVASKVGGGFWVTLM